MTPFEQVMARRLDPQSGAPLAVALSGGGDSLALLHLAMTWAKRRGRPTIALTIDHGLNPDSGAWTTAAGKKARAMGAEWRGLTWEGPKPSAGIQARARAARHALLAEAARAAGARVLMMGHTADDVMESDVMRAADVPGLGRLREWSPSPAWPSGRDLFLLRPLLAIRRPDLRTYLRERSLDWLEDPANLDTRFSRVRARLALAQDEPDRRTSPVINLDPAIPVLARRFEFGPHGARVERQSLVEAPTSIASPVLAAALLCVSSTQRPPRRAELDRLFQGVVRGETSTLAGCRIRADASDLHLFRESPRRGQTQRPLEPTDWVRTRFEAACGLIPDEPSAARGAAEDGARQRKPPLTEIV